MLLSDPARSAAVTALAAIAVMYGYNAPNVRAMPAITVGTHQVLAGTPGQRVPITVSGGDPVAGVNLLVQTGDGGVALGGNAHSAPRIQDVDVTGTGTVFASNNNGHAYDDPPTDQLWQVHTATAAGTVAAAGVLAYVTVDTTGFVAGGSYPLLLGGIAGDPTLNSDFAGVLATVQNGQIVLVPEPSWDVDSPGLWSTGSNWVAGRAPNAPGAAAGFRGKITAPRLVTLDVPTTVGSVTFANDAAQYTIAASGSNSLTFDGNGSAARLNVTSGDHTIVAPVALASDLAADVSAGSVFTLTGPMTAVGSATLTSGGAGLFRVKALRITGVSVAAGKLQVLPDGSDAGTSKVGSLTVAAGATLDLSDNDLVLDYTGTSPAPTVVGRLAAARGAGDWTGDGITSSAAAADPQKRSTIAWAEASAILGLTASATAIWSGQTVDATSLLMKYTWYGDANMDGQVNADDYALIDRGMAKGLAGWVNGDFNYDGVVNSGDYLLIDRVFIQQGGVLGPDSLAARFAQFGDGYVRTLLATVPEPGTASIVALTVSVTTLRRQRGKVQTRMT
jgi:hypothetical protein